MVRGNSPADVYADYQERLADYQVASEEIEARVKRALDGSSITPVLLDSRWKEPIELFKKQRRKSYPNFWADCPDVTGTRIVVSVASEKVAVCEALKASDELDVIDVEDQSATADPVKLEYRGLHVHVRATDLIGADGIGIRCEVQIRTAAEHAWAETEHKYLYKKSEGIPNEIQRIFLRLLALVELFDEELQKGVVLVKNNPAFAQNNLARHLEQRYASITSTLGDETLTREVLNLLALRGYGNAEELAQAVESFLSQKESEVRTLLATHGPSAEGFDPEDHWLISQPESLLFLALLDSDEYRLSNALAGEEIAPFVEPLARWTNHPGFAR